MLCPKCRADLPAGSTVCAVCGADSLSTVLQLPADQATALALPQGTGSGADAATSAGIPMTTPPAPPSVLTSAGSGPLAPGSAFGTRYHLIRLLGMGGMGAVYQAWDEELGVSVALKVIRPEITANPDAARDIERRFKRELLLARQVTHKNVVRIHDLGEINGIKYLTMPYIQGGDLASLLRTEGRLPIPRVLAIARQIGAGLLAAHEAGVVHRDLKPANVMIDADGQAVIMDFGISRSVSGGDATMAGAVIGTLEYMAPEQAMAQPTDHRADIYAFGLILRDMLVGSRNAGGAESAVAELMARMQTPLPPLRSVEPAIPEAVDALVSRCTEPNPTARFDTTRELVAALEALDPSARTSARTAPIGPAIPRAGVDLRPTSASARKTVPIAAVAAAALVLLAVGAWMLRDRFTSGGVPENAAVASTRVSLAVLPFRNGTGDRSLDSLGPSMADMLIADIGQSQQLRLVSSERLFQLLRDLRIGPETDFDSATTKNIGELSNADTILTGRFEKVADQIRINATLHSQSREPVVLRASAAGENDLLRAMQELAGSIRQNLSLAPAALRELQAKAFKPSSSSVQALRLYSEGVQFAREGEHLEAEKRFDGAIQADPMFALAYSKRAQSLANLGRSTEAETTSREAVKRSEQLPVEERDLIAGAHARIVNDIDKAIESYERLAGARPGDSQLHFELAELFESKGNLDKARDEYANVIAADPRHGDALYAAGRVAIQRGDFQGSLESLNTAQNLSLRLDKPELRAKVLQAMGIAYKNLGRLGDALSHYEQSLDIKKQIDDKRGIAASLSEIAQIHDLQGRPERAVASYLAALDIRRTIGDTRGVGITLINLGASHLDRGRYDDALKVFTEALQIQRQVGDENRQALCLSNIGTLHAARAQYEEARTYLERALELREKAKVPGTIALTLTSLADVSTRLGEHDSAQKQYLRAIELWRGAGDKRGAAIGSYGMGTLLEQQGRYGAAVDAKTEALQTFRELQERSYWFAEILSGYGAALSLAGRLADATAPLNEALTLARELKNDMLVAQTLNFQGDAAYFRGDLKAARGLYEQAQQAAVRAPNSYQELRSKVNLAKLTAEESRPQAVIGELKTLRRQAEGVGLRSMAAECSLYLGIALSNAKNVREARTELEGALARGDRLGARPLVARSHHLLSRTLQLAGDAAAAAAHARLAQETLDAVRKDARSDELLARHDLKALLPAPAR